MEAKLETLLNKFETLVTRFEKAQGVGEEPAHAGTQSKILRGFDNEIAPKIKPFQELADKVGGEIVPNIVFILLNNVDQPIH